MFRNPYTDGLIVVLILLLFFGPKRLPTLGRSLGQGLREFKTSITGESSGEDQEDRPEITKASASTSDSADAPAEPTPAGTASPADHAG